MLVKKITKKKKFFFETDEEILNEYQKVLDEAKRLKCKIDFAGELNKIFQKLINQAKKELKKIEQQNDEKNDEKIITESTEKIEENNQEKNNINFQNYSQQIEKTY